LCKEAHSIRKKLVQIFILIKEREKLVNNNIIEFNTSSPFNHLKQAYLNCLIKNIIDLDKKIQRKIAALQAEHTIIGKPFILYNKVIYMYNLIGLLEDM